MNLKNQKGITMITEAMTVIVFLIIIATISYSSVSSLQVRKLNYMYADILTLQEKISNYYLKNGSIPVTSEEVDIVDINLDQNQRNPNDGPLYCKIDFQKLLNVSLNNKQTADDFYYINLQSFVVYYSTGVEVDNLNNSANPTTTYYTLPSNYTNVRNIDIDIYQ